MRAVRVHQYGGPEVLRFEEAKDPVPGPGEALVRVRAVAVNHVELDIRAGVSRLDIGLPAILGAEFAGDLVSVDGEAPEGAVPGARVTAVRFTCCGRCEYCRTGRDNLCTRREMLGVTRPGADAELVCVPSAALIALPDGFPYETAAATQVGFSIAWHLLINRAALRAGQTVLVHAAGSGVGSAALQVARHAGARVIATASTEAKRARAAALADATVDYTRPGWPAEVIELTDGRGADVVVSHVGGQEFLGSLEAVRADGVVVVVGAHGGEVVPLDLITLFRRQIRVIGSSRATQHEVRLAVAEVCAGRFTPTIDTVLPLAELATAHRRLEERSVFGKVVCVA